MDEDPSTFANFAFRLRFEDRLLFIVKREVGLVSFGTNETSIVTGSTFSDLRLLRLLAGALDSMGTALDSDAGTTVEAVFSRNVAALTRRLGCIIYFSQVGMESE